MEHDTNYLWLTMPFWKSDRRISRFETFYFNHTMLDWIKDSELTTVQQFCVQQLRRVSSEIIESLLIFKHVEIQQFGWLWTKMKKHAHTWKKVGQHPSKTLHNILLSQSFIHMHERYISNKSFDSCLSSRYNRYWNDQHHSHLVFRITMGMTGIPEKKGQSLNFDEIIKTR